MAVNRTTTKNKKVIDVPRTPVIGTATSGAGSASVAFTAATGGNGSPIVSSYTVRSTPGNFLGTGTTSPITVSGILGYTNYTFAVAGTNGTGTGTYSAESNSLLITTVPGAPTVGTVTVANTSAGSVSVPFTAPADNGGVSITSYVVLSSSGESTSGSTSPITLTEVLSGSYTYQVRAINSVGTSTYSSSSNAVSSTPPLVRISYLVAAGGGGAAGPGYEASAGGGAGGVRGGNSSPYTIYFNQTPGTTYTVTIGGGGAGTGNAVPGMGTASSVSGTGLTTITASGGAGTNYTTGGIAGKSGGCGSGAQGQDFGGTSGTTYSGGAGNSGAYSPAEGYSGGNSSSSFVGGPNAYYGNGGSGGGGGGSGYVTGAYWNGSQVVKQGAYGGSGKYFAEDAYSYWGGGGGAGSKNYGVSGYNNGGTGGGGRGYNTGTYAQSNSSGTANTGGGGGAGGGGYTGGSGGSGVVLFAYPSQFGTAVSTTGSPTYTDNGTYKIYKFTGSGSIRFV